jgi:hypothetical protein
MRKTQLIKMLMSLCGSNMLQKRALITQCSRKDDEKNPPIKGAPKSPKSSISKAPGRIPRLFLMMPSVSKKLLFYAKSAVFDFMQDFWKKYLSF